MCAALAARKDPAEELEFAVSLINRVVEPARSTAVRPIVGLHVCRGNWSQDETTLLRGLVPSARAVLPAMDVDQLVLEYATPRAGEFVPVDGKSIGLGVVNPRIPRDRVGAGRSSTAWRRCWRTFLRDQVFLNPDCGFATFTSRAMNSADVAAVKIAAMAEAARVLRRQLGIRN